MYTLNIPNKIAALMFICMLVFLGACEDRNAAANRMYVEAAILFKQAESIRTPNERRAMALKIKSLLNGILKDYPDTDAAVRMITRHGNFGRIHGLYHLEMNYRPSR